MQAFERELAAQISGRRAQNDRRPGSSDKQPYSGGSDKRHGHHHHHKAGYKSRSRPTNQHRYPDGKCSADYNLI